MSVLALPRASRSFKVLLNVCLLLGICIQSSNGFCPAPVPLLRRPQHVASRIQMSATPPSTSPGLAASRRGALAILLGAPAAAFAQAAQAEALAAATAAPAPAPAAGGTGLTCDDAISELRNDATGQVIYLIGTAHVSELSARLVEETIRAKKPDTVMIELDKKRVRSSIGPRKEPTETTPQSFWQLARSEFGKNGPSIGEKVASFKQGVIGMVIGGLYTKLNQMGFSSGQEFVVAIREAKALNATIVLGDRGVDQTLSRLQESLDKSGFGAVQKFIERQQENEVLITGGMTEAELADDKESLTKTIEALKERRTVRALMATLKESLPEVHAALIAERDAFMVNSLLQAKGRNTVAVVGMAHMDGIEANLGDTGFKKVVCSIS